MGSSSTLAGLLDFDVGLDFEAKLIRTLGKRVHHLPDSRSGGSFFLLATFRRYLFWLTEDSVALALQSCLGGFEDGFDVTYLSHNHFRFSVSCKAMGFAIYELRRFMGRSFDIYFHLWNYGVPRWEREEWLFEEAAAKKWTKILSKSLKRQAKKAENSLASKRVRFVEKLVQPSPLFKSRCLSKQREITIGSFKINLALHVDSVVSGEFKPSIKTSSNIVFAFDESDVMEGKYFHKANHVLVNSQQRQSSQEH